MTSAALREYLLKGVFLGLWAYLALARPGDDGFARAAGWAVGGLAAGLAGAVAVLLRRGLRPAANPGGFALLALLDGAYPIYLGLVGGLAVGVFTQVPPADGPADPRDWKAGCAAAGALVGYLFYLAAAVRSRAGRVGLAVAVGAGLAAAAVAFLDGLPGFADAAARRQFAVRLLAGLPLFYVLVFCGDTDESEAEFAALCGGLGVGLYLLRLSSGLPEYADKLIFVAPAGLYYAYAVYVLPYLRSFKHTLRGYGHLSLGRVPEALASFGRAVELERRRRPADRGALATAGLLALHRRLDPAALDDRTADLLDYEFCLGVAERHLVGDRPPTDAERAEAERMLALVADRRPGLAPRADYLRAVADAHAKRFDAAAAALSRLLDPAHPYPTPAVRDGVLYPAWELALRLHPELVKRLGPAELAKPGRRADAIRAVERRLAEEPADAGAIELRRELYSGLTEADLPPDGPAPAGLNYDHVEQLGLAVADDPDPARRDRGMAFLRIAGRGLPGRGPGIFTKLAELAAAAGRPDEAHGYLERVKEAGLAVGVTALPADQKPLFAAAVRQLSEAAAAHGDHAAAVADFRLFLQATGETVDGLRKLADLYDAAGDVLNALLITHRGLIYAAADPDLLQRKQLYYKEASVERVAEARDKVSPWFDVPYLVKTAKQVADQKEPDADTLQWGLHLARLARVVRPDVPSTMFAEARLRLRLGEREAGLKLLEDLREKDRGSGDDEDAWYAGVRLLGDLYLDEWGRPDLAVDCYKAYRRSPKSGADTLYQLGRALEAAGDPAGAVKAFEAVTAYAGHPRYWDATDAVRRLKAAAGPPETT